jgi:hypothetical protein
MISKLESELIRTLSAAADAAPAAAPAFADEVRDRQHRRERQRTRLVVAAAAATVVAVTLSVLGVVARTSAQPQPGSPTGGPTTGPTTAPYSRGPRLADARPAEQVWPQALVTLPARLADGRAYTLTTIVGDGRFVVVPNQLGDFAGPSAEVLLWEPGRGSVRTLGPPPTIPGIATTTLWGLPGVGDGYVAWTVQGYPAELGAEPAYHQEIWVAPLAGGAARRLAVVREHMVGEVVHVIAGRVYWGSVPSPGFDHPDSKLFSVPVGGGRVTEVPGGHGFGLLRTPGWARTTGEDTDPSQVWNFADGTRRDTRFHDFMEFECSPSWCIGRDSTERPAEARRHDGRATLRPDFNGRFITTTNENIVIGVVDYPPDPRYGRVVWDLRTGALGTGPEYNRDPSTSSAQSMVWWLNQDGTMTVLDPRAIR